MTAGSRIVVYGPSGAGKTTFARELGGILGLAVVELDAVLHGQPGWQRPTREEYRHAILDAMANATDGWIVEGNDTSDEDVALPLADTIIWLRLPFRVTYPRFVRRSIRYAYRREQPWGGNRVTWKSICGRRSVLAWGLYDWRPNQARTRRRLRQRPPGARVHILRSQRAVDEFLEAQRAAHSPRC